MSHALPFASFQHLKIYRFKCCVHLESTLPCTPMNQSYLKVLSWETLRNRLVVESAKQHTLSRLAEVRTHPDLQNEEHTDIRAYVRT